MKNLSLLLHFCVIAVVACAQIKYEGLVLTSIDLTLVANTTNTYSFSGGKLGDENDGTASFLKNITQVNEKDKDGQRLFHCEKVSVAEAKDYINANEGGKPLFCMHGFQTQPGAHLKECNKSAKKFDSGKFTLLPVIWPTRAGVSNGNYLDNRRKAAIGAANSFRALKNKVDVFPEKSIMCHSMANWILRHAADAKFKFDNIFMVAADVRHNIFDSKYTQSDKDDAEMRGDGARICSMLRDKSKGKVHCLINRNDYALTGSSWLPANFDTRLGQVGAGKRKNFWGLGWNYKEERLDPACRGCIENKPCQSSLFPSITTHGYQFKQFAIDYYQSQHF